MTGGALSESEKELVEAAIVRLRARVMAVVFGMLGGVGLWLASVWLVVRGGPNVGQHLGLLSNYFPGYEVSWLGSFIGFGYGALCGAAIGWSIASIYNRIAHR